MFLKAKNKILSSILQIKLTFFF